jgi:hypothetical protein
MATYNVYPAVEKVQAWLNTLLDAGEQIDEDGKWGDQTEAAYRKWASTREGGTDLAFLGVVDGAERDVIAKARTEYGAGGVGDDVPKTPPVVPASVDADKSWSTTTWLLIGVAVASAAVGGWWWMKHRKASPRPKLRAARSHAGLKGGGCGCGG